MPGLIAYTGNMPAKRTTARGRLDMVLTPEDEAILSFIESGTGLNRSGAVRLILREALVTRGGSLVQIRESLAKQDAPKEGEG